jgi:transaldolase
MADSNLHKLSKRGVSVWIDYLSRDLLEEGELARMMKEDAVVGVTSNPTIFQKAISQGTRYDEQLKELLEHENDPKEIFLHLSARDVGAALELLAPVHEKTGYDGFVSWEVDPTLAYDRDATFEEAMRLHEWIDKPNLYVKIPATKPGLGAIEDCVAAGKNINITLIFSLQRYAEVVEAYLRGTTPRPTSDSRRSARRTRSHCAASSLSRTRSSRTSTSSRPSPARAGSSSPARARTRSAACGPRPRRRTRRTATCSTSRS